MLNAFRGILVCLVMYFTSFFGSLTLQIVFIWLTFISPKCYRIIMDYTMVFWVTTVVAMMKYLLRIDFRLYGDSIDPNDRAVFIMNHRTRLDWLYFYGILFKYGLILKDEKIVLKSELKWIPGAGWAMQSGGYIFLVRNLQKDSNHLTNFMEYFCKLGRKTKILLFPEGTDFSEVSLNRSNKFAEDNLLPKYKYVLHPRTAGFNLIIQDLMRFSQRNGEKLDKIYDVTVAYPDTNFATNELEFLLGRSSREVHFKCRSYPIESIFNNDMALLNTLDDSKSVVKSRETVLKNFLANVWKEKEALLDQYYSSEASRRNPEQTFQCKEVIQGKRCADKFQEMFKSLIFSGIIIGNVVLNCFLLYYYTKVWFAILLFLASFYISFNRIYSGLDNFIVRHTLGAQNFRSCT